MAKSVTHNPSLRSMHIHTGVDRPSLNWHVCSPARLLQTNAARCHDRHALRRKCSCSCAASTSDGSAEHCQFQSQRSSSTARCIHSAKRALKRALRRDRSQDFSHHDCWQAAPVPSNHSRPSRYSTCTGRALVATRTAHWAPFLTCRKSAAKLCFLLSAAILPGRGFADLGQNYVFMAGFWGWFLAQTCKVKAVQAQPHCSQMCSVDARCLFDVADLYKTMAQRSLGLESSCGFWWHAILTFCSVLGAKLSDALRKTVDATIIISFACHTAMQLMQCWHCVVTQQV